MEEEDRPPQPTASRTESGSAGLTNQTDPVPLAEAGEEASQPTAAQTCLSALWETEGLVTPTALARARQRTTPPSQRRRHM